MIKRQIGRSTWSFQQDIAIVSHAAVVGPMEGKGLLGEDYDLVYEDLYMGQDTWEKAERKMMEDVVKICIQKGNFQEEDMDLYLAGDLLNQNISASFSAKSNQIPFLGVYGACSTSMLTLSLAAALVDGGFAKRVVASVSSHNCTAEKQYRYPTEYGGQKPDTAQWTVTGAGAGIVGLAEGRTDLPHITYATMGKVVDLGEKNPFDMGTAMAPAAADTIRAHLEETQRQPNDYDLIVTGDLGRVGHPIAKELLAKAGYQMGENFKDCGLMIYRSDQEVFAGASGCASSAVVTYGHLLDEMKKGTYQKILVVATGALLSPLSYQQGDSIPCVAHAVAFEMR